MHSTPVLYTESPFPVIFSMSHNDRTAGKIGAVAMLAFQTSPTGFLSESERITLHYPIGFFAISATPSVSMNDSAEFATCEAPTSTSIVFVLSSGSNIAANSTVSMTITGVTMGPATYGDPVGLFVSTTSDAGRSDGISSGYIGNNIASVSAKTPCRQSRVLRLVLKYKQMIGCFQMGLVPAAAADCINFKHAMMSPLHLQTTAVQLLARQLPM